MQTYLAEVKLPITGVTLQYDFKTGETHRTERIIPYGIVIVSRTHHETIVHIPRESRWKDTVKVFLDADIRELIRAERIRVIRRTDRKSNRRFNDRAKARMKEYKDIMMQLGKIA
jgi:hypothetical protein